MARLTLDQIAAAARGTLALGTPPPDGGSAHPIDGYSIDTRSLNSGDLFFAIVGPRVDGHDYVDSAIERGAGAVVVARGGPARWPKSPAVVRVEDTTKALQDAGGHVRRRQPMKVVGITGSAGKTTAKEMTAAVLRTRFRTHASEGNLNNTYGLPLTLLRMPDDTQAAVLEMGMSSKGEIARLAEIADPDIGIILNVLRVHLEHFGGLDDIAAAKGELFAGLRKDAIAVYNADDPRVTRLGRAFPGKSIAYGLAGRFREVAAEQITVDGVRGTRFILRRGADRVPVRLRIPGRHHVHNALAAAAAGFACGVGASDIAAGLGSVQPAAMRGVLHDRADGVEILDESYNSNPTAMDRIIELLRGATVTGRKILATGDMLELGPYAARAHARVGELALAAGIDLLVAVGPLSERTVDAARRGAARKGGVTIGLQHFADSAAAGAWLAGEVRPGDLVVVKGSRGIRMERVVDALLGRTAAGGTH